MHTVGAHGSNIPALGFGMGDVVLGELLADRGLFPAPGADGADLYLVAGNGAVGRPYAEALRLVSALRGAGFSVNHGLNAERFLSQATRNQVDGAKKAGAAAVIGVREDGRIEVTSILGRMKDAPTHVMDPAATLAADATTLQALRDWLAEQRATARETNG